MRGKPLVYLDNAATTQKPQVVIDAITRYYTEYNANVHRGVHELSEVASEAYEEARRKVAAFFNAPHERQIIFTRNATESINLVAHAFGRTRVGAGDEVLISAMEHHSNIVPWQLLCEERGARLRVAPMNDRGELMLDELEALVGERTKLVAVTHMSNALGTINPVEEIVRIAHAAGCRCSSTGRRRRTTCRSTSRRSTATSTSPPATSCTARPAWACSTARRRSSSRCRRSSAAAT